MKAVVAGGVSGLLFALGLGLGGMTDLTKVRAFLDVTRDWDPSLAFVMGGALAVFVPLRWLIRRRLSRPVFNPTFAANNESPIDARLLGGAALFGVGWGWAGLCPGPAIVNLASGTPQIAAFLVAMLAGMLLVQQVELRLRGNVPQPQNSRPDCG